MKALTKKSFFEFLRYAIVGGIASLADMATNYLLLYFVFKADKDNIPLVILCVALGFLVGLVINFVLSNVFVFTTDEQKKKGKTVKAFFISFAVALIGFGLTEGLTLLGTFIIGDAGIFYILLTCFVKCVVLFWNYIGRKVFVYKNK